MSAALVALGVVLVGIPAAVYLTSLIIARRQPQQAGDRAMHRIADGVWFYRGYFSNSAALVFDTCVVVVDTQVSPWGARHFRRCLEEITDRPVRYVINTHYHGDHVGGNAAFPEAEVITTADTKRLLEERDDERVLYAEVFGLLFQGVPEVGAPDRVFEGSLELEIDGQSLWIYQCGQIETEDACIVWWPDRQVVVTGDGVATHGYPFLGVPFLDEGLRYDGEWLEHLRFQRELGAEILLPGHGPALIGNADIDARLELLHDVMRDVLDESRKALDTHLPTLRAAWADGTLPTGDVPRATVDAIVDQVQRTLAHYPQRPDLEEHVACQRFAVYRAINSALDERRGRGWWDDLRPSVHPPMDLARGEAAIAGLDAGQVIERAQALAAKKAHGAALELTTAWLEAHPDDAVVLGWRGELYVGAIASLSSRIDGTELLKAAVESARRALAIDPEQPQARLTLGLAMVLSDLMIGQPPDAAVAHLEAALASGGLTGRQRQKARLLLGKVHQFCWQPAEADQQFRQVLPAPLRPLYPLTRRLFWSLR